MIDEPQGESVTVIPFNLWPAQLALAWSLMTERLLLILKARQLGISWLCCAYALWLCLFQEGRVVLLFSKGQIEANELARRILVLYERLPEWMRAAGPALVTQNTTELAWDNGSRVQSLAATKNAGRSFTASLVIADEFAFLQWPDTLYTAMKPTVDGGGQLIILSTAGGENNLFHALWKEAAKGASRFRPIFLPWQARPDRDADWYAQVEADAVSPLLVQQEYPATPEEAFVSTGGERFLPAIGWWDNCYEMLPPLTPQEPMVIAADAGVSNDCFGLVGVTRHPRRPEHVAVRFVQKWEPRGGQSGGQIDFEGTEDDPGPERVIRALAERHNVLEMAYDPYQLHQMATRIRREGRMMVREFPQKEDRLEADKGLLDLVTQRRIAHDGNTDLRSHIDNADRKTDLETRKLRIVKRTPSLKVDLAVALSMGAYRCLKLPL